MRPSDIIAVAKLRTGSRGAQVLDLNSELLIVIQSLCKAHMWSWRSPTLLIPLTANVKNYDLSVLAPDFQEEQTVKIVVDPATTPTLNKVVETSEQGAIFDGVLPGQPDRYFINGAYELWIYPAPDTKNAAFPLRMNYWAVPNTITDSNGNLLATVPLVPPYMHDVLVKGLEKEIVRYTVGEEDAKYELTAKEYDTLVAQAWGS